MILFYKYVTISNDLRISVGYHSRFLFLALSDKSFFDKHDFSIKHKILCLIVINFKNIKSKTFLPFSPGIALNNHSRMSYRLISEKPPG